MSPYEVKVMAENGTSALNLDQILPFDWNPLIFFQYQMVVPFSVNPDNFQALSISKKKLFKGKGVTFKKTPCRAKKNVYHLWLCDLIIFPLALLHD